MKKILTVGLSLLLGLSALAGIKTDTIVEQTPGAGVTVDGVVVKDGTITAPGNITADSFTLTDGTPIGGDITSTTWDGSNWTATDTAPSQSAVQGALLTAVKDVTDTTYELAVADAGKLLTLTNANLMTVTIPTGLSTYGRPILIRQGGAGRVSIVAGSGVMISSPHEIGLGGLWNLGELMPVGENEWQWSVLSRREYDSYLVAAMHFEGAHGLTTFTDDSQPPALRKGITRHGDAIISTTQKKFGASSLYLDGSDQLSMATIPAFSLGTRSWCVEYWARMTSAKDYRMMFTLNPTATWQQNAIRIDCQGVNADKFWIGFGNGAGWVEYWTSDATMTINTWHHVALTCDGTKIRFFVDGVKYEEKNAVSIYPNASGILLGGDYAGTTQGLEGYIDDFRFFVDTPVYVDTFTPPDRSFTP